MRRVLHYAGFICLLLIVLFVLFLAYSTVTCFKPLPEQDVWQSCTPDTIPVDSSLNLLSWNIGYAGLGDNMDFFYDDGVKVRDTEARTRRNLDSIVTFVQRRAAGGFVMLQEVDLNSVRSYSINQLAMLADCLKCHSAVGVNYRVAFVPIPVGEPMGRVNSGVVTLGRPVPCKSTRYQYPGEFAWPNRLFNLRRCMLVSRYPTQNGRELVLINTHNSAFDDGSLKKQEMDYLRAFAVEEYSKGNYVVVGGDWNQSPPNFPLGKFASNYTVPFFRLTNIAPDFFPNGWQWVSDTLAPTNRYLNQPYVQGQTYEGILDFFLLSPNVSPQVSKTYNLRFKHSDHNPVSLCFKLKK
ncbi:MAG: endonuclease/exonuclease/phosphatase family protein [Bacteroidales bacterium]|nr:endonuclease/exonuclease/phosphatase family protein [Bacteroidales bacterium]